MSQVYKFDCGCTFPIIGYNGKQPIIKFNPDFETINLECERTWDLFKEGNTKGCFQLETQLGQTTSAKVKPNCIQELSDILSIVRPGCLESLLEDGISVTEHYIRRKHGQEEIKYLVPELEPILKKTYGLLIYQEQAIMIAVKLAGFTLGEADGLRKAIGKKDTTKMAAVKKMFMERAKSFGVINEEQAVEIFGWIEKSQRYSFNKCAAINTLINTVSGQKTLEQLQVGEYVNSPFGYIEVIDKIDTGEQELYEIELESGKTFQCTLDHKFLCSDNNVYPLWKILEDNLSIITK